MTEYTKICTNCGNLRIFKNKQSYLCTKSEICGSCSSKKRNLSGENNPFYGKKHSESTKKLMSDNHSDVTGDNNPFKKSLLNEENLAKHKKRVQKFWDSKDKNYRKDFGSKLSVSNAKAKNNTSYKKHLHGHYITKDGQSYYYRSSWEKTTLEYLDKLKENGKIKSFSLEPFCIEYFHEERRYALRIDFLVELDNDTKIILECKPVGLRTVGKNPIKIEAYKDYCHKHNIKFILYGKEEIKTIEDFWDAITRSNS